MNYAVGCGFTTQELFENFPYKKLKLNCKQCEEIINDRHRDILVRRIFRTSIKIILDDIINNNVTFVLPLTNAMKSVICMQKFSDKKFMDCRKNGKWKDIDYLKSGFTGYQLVLKMYGDRPSRTKPIYLNSAYKNRITTNTNNGFQYGDGKIDTTIMNYVDQVCELYPKVEKSDILKILKFGWKSLYLHNSYGGDVFISDSELWMYIGKLTNNSISHYYQYKEKLALKIRILYKRRKIEWDGYYYFSLPENQYNDIFKPQKRGRKIKNRTFTNVFLYQILEECKLRQSGHTRIFRIPYISNFGMKKYLPTLRTDKAELIITRQPLKFKDILVSENKYDIL